MSELAVVTPTYRPDADLFAHLHRSVLEHTPADTVHHVVVPASAVSLRTARNSEMRSLTVSRP